MSIADSTEGTTGINICPECKHSHIVRDYNRGEVTCKNCGLVLDEQLIDNGAEYRNFDQDPAKDRSHYGSKESLTVHDKNLPTDISPRNKDATGNNISPENRKIMYRLRKWQKRIRVSNGSERNLATAMTELNRLSGAMYLPDNIKESAAMIYRKAVKKNLIRGRSIDGVVAASLYAACRQQTYGSEKIHPKILFGTESDRYCPEESHGDDNRSKCQGDNLRERSHGYGCCCHLYLIDNL